MTNQFDPNAHGQPPGAAPAPGAPDVKAAASSATSYLRGPVGRSERRPTPRFTVLLAVAGALLMTVGPLAAASVAEVSDGLMTVLFLLLLGGGYALVWLFRNGPLATAGATASAIALPMLLAVAFDSDSGSGNVGLVLLLSFAGWLAAYLVGPGRGHVVYAGFAMTGLGLWLVDKVGGSGELSDPTVPVLWGFVIIGALWLGAGYGLDKLNLAGVATAFVGSGAAFVVTAGFWVMAMTGATAMGDVAGDNPFSSGSFGGSIGSDDYAGLILPGVALLAVGVGAIRYGVGASRRATAWVGTFAFAIGGFSLITGLFSSNGALLVIAMVLIGAGVVAGAWFLSGPLGEADELSDSPSFAQVGLLQAIKEAVPTRTPTPAPAAPYATAQPGQPAQPFQTQPTQQAQPFQAPSAAPAAQPDPSSPPQPGWWLASDGNWYPPSQASGAAPAAPAAPAADGPPAPGWWMASDGNWYPPQGG